jgi:hypothetical protein
VLQQGACTPTPPPRPAADCAGVLGGSATTDKCGTCDADPLNDCKQDCAGQWGGSKVSDACGVCGGNGKIDKCGTCDADPLNDCKQDCAGQWGGNKVNDACGVCGGNGKSCVKPPHVDDHHRAAVCVCMHGTAATGKACVTNGQSLCSACNGGYVLQQGACTPTPPPRPAADCAGVLGGSATTDKCGTCDADPLNDCKQDCAGQWGGSKVNDACGVCGGNGKSCIKPPHVDDHHRAAVCVCMHGTAATGRACVTNGQSLCSACNGGYVLQQDACTPRQQKGPPPPAVQPQCTCNNGVPATGSGCARDGQALCAKCFRGHVLQRGSCTSKRAKPPLATRGSFLQIKLTVGANINTIPAGTAQRATFEADFKRDVAILTGVNSAQITITSIVSGSVVVAFIIAPNAAGVAVKATHVIASLSVGASVASSTIAKPVAAADVIVSATAATPPPPPPPLPPVRPAPSPPAAAASPQARPEAEPEPEPETQPERSVVEDFLVFVQKALGLPSWCIIGDEDTGIYWCSGGISILALVSVTHSH